MKNYTKFGYTLVELLVSITIIGLLFSFGFASFREFSRRQALASATKTIIGDLRLIQQLASSGKKPDSFSCDSPDILHGYGVLFSQNQYSTYVICSGGNVDVKTVDLVGITISPPLTNPIIFKVLNEGTNIPAGVAQTLTITQEGTLKTNTIMINSTGEIK